MSTTVSVAGSSYSVPQEGDSGWATDVTNLLIQLATSTKVLQVTSSSFPLTQDLSFGTNYGLKLQYLKSQAANPASTGSIRLGNTESIKWRNAANNADLDLTVSASDILQFNGSSVLMPGIGSIVNADISNSAAIAYSKLNLTGNIVNADISASAAIAYSKLSLSNSIVNADISSSAAIAYSKLSLSNSIVNADISSSAAIAYSKLSLTSSIVDADISGSAAIARSKLAALTASRVMVTDGSGNDSASSVTSTTLSYLDATSSIQTQLDAKVAKTLTTTTGDMIYASSANTPARLAIGTSGQVLKTVGGVPTWATFSGGINYLSSNPDAEADTSGWATFADAAGTTPVDGTGGSPNSTWTRTTSSPLRGSGSFLWTKNSGASRQGEGVSFDFTIDASDKGKVLQGSFEYSIASGTFADDEMTVWIYDVTNAAMIQPAPYKLKNHSMAAEKFGFEFQTSSNSTSYRLIIFIPVTTNSANTLKFDNFNIGPQAKLYGSPITDAVAYTPTFTGFGTVTNINVKSQRIGDSLRVFGYFQTGTNTGVEARMTLGYGGVDANVNIDTSKIGNTVIIGSAASTESGSATYFLTAPLSGTTNYIKWGRQTSTATVTAAANGNAWTNSVYISFDLMVPIQGWSSSAIMSSDANTSVVAASYYLTSNLTINTTATDITGWSLITDTNGAFNTTTGVYTYPVAGKYKIQFTGRLDTGGSASTQHIINFISGGTTYVVNAATDLVASKSYNYSPSLIVDVRAGDTFKIQGQSVTNSSTAIGGQCFVSIERLSGPSQILATDTVAALYTGAPPTGTLTSAYNTTTFGTKRKDSHNAYSGGTYIVPSPGTYSIQAQARHDATYSAGNTAGIALFINGVQYETGVVNAAGAVVTLWPLLSVHGVPLLAGDLVTIRSYDNGTSPTFGSNSNQNFFSIVRTGNY